MSHASPHADAAPDEAPTPPPIVSAVTHGPMVAVLRAFALGMTVATVMFVVNNYLNFWRDWPGVPALLNGCLLYTSPSPRDQRGSRMPSSA